MNANSAHPYENPSGLTNLIEIGRSWSSRSRSRARSAGWQRISARAGCSSRRCSSSGSARPRSRSAFELAGNPRRSHAGSRRQHGGQGGALRARSIGLFAASTTGTSTGAVIAAHDSFTPLGGAVPLVNMMLGEVSPGGVGSGLYGMLVFALLARLHRRSHGRANARVPRQEDPGRGDEARRRSTSSSSRSVILAFAASGASSRAQRRRSSTPVRTGCRRSSTPSRPRRTTTAPRSAGSRATPTGTTRRSVWRCSSAVSCSSSRCSPIAGSLARKQPVPATAGHVPDRDAALRRPARRGGGHRRRSHVLPRRSPSARSWSSLGR